MQCLRDNQNICFGRLGPYFYLSYFGSRLWTCKCTMPRPDLFEKSEGVEIFPSGPRFGLIPAIKSNNIIRHCCLRFFDGGLQCPLWESNREFDEKTGFFGMRINMSEFMVLLVSIGAVLSAQNVNIVSVCFDGKCMKKRNRWIALSFVILDLSHSLNMQIAAQRSSLHDSSVVREIAQTSSTTPTRSRQQYDSVWIRPH